MEHLNVGHLVEGDDVGLETLKNGERLLGASGMRLTDGELVVRVSLVPGADEGRVEVLKKFTGHIV